MIAFVCLAAICDCYFLFFAFKLLVFFSLHFVIALFCVCFCSFQDDKLLEYIRSGRQKSKLYQDHLDFQHHPAVRPGPAADLLLLHFDGPQAALHLQRHARSATRGAPRAERHALTGLGETKEDRVRKSGKSGKNRFNI